MGKSYSRFSEVRPRRRSLQNPYTSSRVQQHFKDECDVNVIMARYRKTGQISHVSNAQAIAGDFSSNIDFQAQMQAIVDAKKAFADLPSKIRSRFNHDPGQLVDFLRDDKNRDEAISLGFIDKPQMASGADADPAQPPAAPQTPAEPASGGASSDPPA